MIQLTRFVLMSVLALSVPIAASAHPKNKSKSKLCVPLAGTFESQTLPSDQCNSPVGLCTAGSLTGSLRGSYGYTAATLTSANDPTIPFVFFYTGRSMVETRNGSTLIGTDSGTLDLDPDGFGNFTALITFTEATGKLEGSRSQISLVGHLDLETGTAEGTYRGMLCKAE